MENLDYIDNYFKELQHDEEEKKQFEKKITEDPSFADDVAFYISANGLLKQQVHEEKKERFREIYNNQKVISISRPVRNLWKYAAAACLLIAIFSITWFITSNKNSPKQLADAYIQKNFTNLGVTMGTQDSLETAKSLANSNKLNEALQILEKLATNKNSDVINYAGIVSLRLQDYDKALSYFSLLEAKTGLFSNPGKFYRAITLIERNKDGDKEAAWVLLQEVKDKNLEGKSDAEEWLKKLN